MLGENVAGFRTRPDVTLGEIAEASASRMLAWMQTPHVAEPLGLSVTPTLERTQSWIQRAVLKQDVRAWAILAGDEHVGNVVFDQIDYKALAARLSVYIGPAEFRHSGIGTTALYLGLQRIFEELSLHRVWLTVHAENAAAIRLYRSVGFRCEGILREAFVCGSRRVDAIYMGLLRREFSLEKAADR